MGSNQRKHFDRGIQEWGSKARKEGSRGKKKILDELSIEDSALSNTVDRQKEMAIDLSVDDGYGSSGYGHPPIKKKHKKDTKRWCRGKVGREHDWVFIHQKNNWWPGVTKLYSCSACSKRKYERLQ